MCKYLCFCLILVAAACSRSPAEVGAGNVRRDSVAAYLDEIGLNTPGVVDNVVFALNGGNKFRERVVDKYGKRTMLTAWIERQARSTFCVTYYRDEKCPDCKGSGQRKAPNMIGGKVDIAFDCRKCKGTGVLLNQSHRRCWMLAPEEFSGGAQARVEPDWEPLRNAPEGIQERIRALSSDEPRERLDACVWLDRRYIKVGQNFQELTPILERAQYVGQLDPHSKLLVKIVGKRLGQSGETVYQFLAGRGIPSENGRAYYRVFVDNNDGKVVKTMFVAENPRRK